MGFCWSEINKFVGSLIKIDKYIDEYIRIVFYNIIRLCNKVKTIDSF
jgi:hypothetical protein